MRFALVPSLLALVIAIAACSGDDETDTVTVRETVTSSGTATVPDEARSVVALYFLRDGKVWPERRGIVSGPAVATATLQELFAGPETDLATAIQASDAAIRLLEIAEGVASLELDPPLTDLRGRAQVVYTLTQFPTVERVALNGGRPVDRGDFERQTPAILVESPTAGETVEPGFEATGTANTFEATFNYELKDSSGRVLREDFVTATSGSGTRGTFRFTVPYEVPRAQEGTLTVFEISAANGSRANEISIPLRLE